VFENQFLVLTRVHGCLTNANIFSSKIWSHSKILALYVNVKSDAIHAWGWRKLGLRTNSGDLHCQGIGFKSNNGGSEAES
jgi:hypothetical protein